MTDDQIRSDHTDSGQDDRVQGSSVAGPYDQSEEAGVGFDDEPYPEERDWEVAPAGADEWGQVLDDDPDEYVRVPRDASRGRRLAYIAGGVAVFLLLVVGGSAYWLNSQINPSGGEGAVVVVEIPEGSTVDDVASLLEEQGIISNGTVFRFYSRYKGFDAVQAGQYPEMAENSSMGSVIDQLAAGPAAPPPAAQVTVPEGLRYTELEPRVLAGMTEFDEAEWKTAILAAQPKYRPEGTLDIEGFLYPETYRIEEGDEADEQKLVNQMVAEFDAVATELGYDDAAELTGLTPYELIIVASLIEREAQVEGDYGKVSRVIHNRLTQGIPLGVDATLLYAIGHTETLTQSDLETDTPYNTRLYGGLPPTPIAMPGRAALAAAIAPEAGDWLYYVLASDDGTHFFTDDFDEFNRVAQESRDAGLFE